MSRGTAEPSLFAAARTYSAHDIISSVCLCTAPCTPIGLCQQGDCTYCTPNVTFFHGGCNLMHLRTLRVVSLAATVFSVAAFAQAVDTPFQVRYASNLASGDSVVNITNSGAS